MAENSSPAHSSSSQSTKLFSESRSQSLTTAGGSTAAGSAAADSTAVNIEIKKSGTSGAGSRMRASKNEQHLKAAVDIVQGVQADHYDIGDFVFAKHLGWPWPARIEDSSNVPDIVTRFQYVVFLYGIHERKVVKLKELFLFEENLDSLGLPSQNFHINLAMKELNSNPDVNFQRVPPHKKKPVQYLRKSRSHAQLVKYLEDNYLHLVTVKENDEDVTVISDASSSAEDSQFNNTGLVSCDSTLGYFTILSSLLFLAYVTCWLIVMPFLEPNYQQLVDNYFPSISRSIAYPIAAGTVLVSSVVAVFGALMYGPRVHARGWVTTIPRSGQDSLRERRQRLEEFISIIEKRRPAIFIMVSLALYVYSPAIVFVVVLIAFCASHLFFNFVSYL